MIWREKESPLRETEVLKRFSIWETENGGHVGPTRGKKKTPSPDFNVRGEAMKFHSNVLEERVGVVGPTICSCAMQVCVFFFHAVYRNFCIHFG